MSNKELLRRLAANDPYISATRIIRERIAKWYAARKGYTINRGCWIKSPLGKTVCQGWPSFYDRIRRNGCLESELQRLSDYSK